MIAKRTHRHQTTYTIIIGNITVATAKSCKQALRLHDELVAAIRLKHYAGTAAGTVAGTWHEAQHHTHHPSRHSTFTSGTFGSESGVL
jgi:hypothetical protein